MLLANKIDIYNTCKSSDILTVIRASRREWLGHVRLNGGRITRSYWKANEEVEGKKNGGLRVKWMNDVQQDIRNRGVNRR
jgi:hypothetical protein